MKIVITLEVDDAYEEEILNDIVGLELKCADGSAFEYDEFDINTLPDILPSPYLMRQIQIANGIQTEEPPYTEEYQKGYNDCLNEILGEEE